MSYDLGFAALVNIASAPTEMLIPPLMAFIIYLLVAGGASISALFLGGAVAGSLWGISVMILQGSRAPCTASRSSRST